TIQRASQLALAAGRRQIDVAWPSNVPVIFFFSSRRRHTRLQGDWSSDRVLFRSRNRSATCGGGGRPFGAGRRRRARGRRGCARRSEERRVGKECRCRGTWCHVKVD